MSATEKQSPCPPNQQLQALKFTEIFNQKKAEFDALM